MNIHEIMRYCRNFFPYGDPQYGEWTIEDNTISLDFLEEDQLMLIESSQFNDGVWHYGTDTLVNESFTGYITALAPPQDFVNLCDEIIAWQAKYGTTDSPALSPFNSESFAGYSYSKGNNSSGRAATSWKDVFAGRLSVWRKL